MSVARVIEISSTSNKSFEDAITQGVARANQTLRNVKQQVMCSVENLKSQGVFPEKEKQKIIQFFICKREDD